MMVSDMDMARRRVLLGLPWLVGLALAAKHLWAAESPPDRARLLSIKRGVDRSRARNAGA